MHLLVFYADERSTRSPDTLPNKAGGGFRLHRRKTVGVAGLVLLRLHVQHCPGGWRSRHPFGTHPDRRGGVPESRSTYKGEAAISLLYMNPIEEIFDGPVRDQYGLETYWRILLTQNIWITPGVHLIFNPALNQQEDFIAIPQLKFRVAV